MDSPSGALPANPPAEARNPVERHERKNMWLISILFGMILAAVVLLRVYSSSERAGNNKANPAHRKVLPGLTNCPLCQSSMDGTSLKAKSIRTPDGRVILEIRGCDHCSAENSRKKRLCPSCKSGLARGDVVFALYIQSPERVQVQIKGCRYCYRRPHG